MKGNRSKRLKSTLYTLAIFLVVIGIGIFFLLLTLDIVKGKKASNGVMWAATIFCLVIGCGGFFFTILALIKEKIRKKHNFKEDNEDKEKQLSEEALVFKNAIPDLFANKKLNIDNKEKKTYIFKQRKQSIVKFALYDENNNLVYDSKRINKTFFVPLKISFNNHISNKSFSHTIGRILTTDLERNNIYFIPSAYTYRIDDLRVEDFFKRLDIQLIAASEHVYNINYKGSLIGSINIIKDKKINLLGKKVNDMKINCIEEYIDIAFLSCFAIGYATHLTN